MRPHSIVITKDVHSRATGSEILYFAIGGGLLAFLWLTAPTEIESSHKFLAAAGGCLLLSTWFFWIRSGSRKIPFLELLCLHYFLIFCVPVFTGPIQFVGATMQSRIEHDDATFLLLCVLAGFCSLLAGYRGVFWKRKRHLLPLFQLDERMTAKLGLLYLGMGILSPILYRFVPGGLAKFADLVLRVNGSVAVFALATLMYRGLLSDRQKALFFGEFGLFVLINLSTGWLSNVAYPVIAFLLANITVKNRIPWVKILVVCLVILFLNTAKAQFREEVWEGRLGGNASGGITEALSRAERWITLTPTETDAVLTSGLQQTITERVSHIGFFGHVTKLTPDIIPYEDGQTYTAIPSMVIPRILWPDKPSTMDVPNYLAIKYGWLSENLVGTVAVSPGIMDEAYMNFGVPGVVVVMFLLGFAIRWMTDILGDPENGFGWQLVLVGIIVGGGLLITWPLGSYLGGFWQTVAVITALYWKARVKKPSKKRLPKR